MNEYIFEIEELVKATELKRRTIHFYRKEKLIREPSTAGGGAKYHNDTIDRLKLIRHLQKSHIKLSGIRKALNAMSPKDMRNLVEKIEKSSDPVILTDFSFADASPELGQATDESSESNTNIISKRRTDEDNLWHRYILDSGIELHVREDKENRNPEIIQNLRDAFNNITSKGRRNGMTKSRAGNNSIIYPCWAVNEHIFFEVGNDRVLLDTGAPSSMGASGSFFIGGERISLVDKFMDTTIAELSRLIEYRFTVLLGADVLEKFDVTIDLGEGTILFSTGSQQPYDIMCPIEFFMGVPQINVQAGDNLIKTFFDVGSRLTYISSKFTDTIKPISRTQDFYPGIGTFDVDLYHIPFATGPITFSTMAGTLPKELEIALLMGNAFGITGSEFLDDYAVTLSKKRMTAEFRKLN